MDYKEKYEKALNTAKIWYLNPSIPSNVHEIFWKMFPELEESEDDRIKKEITDFILCKATTYELRKKSNSWLTWLEKQGMKNEASSEITEKEKQAEKSESPLKTVGESLGLETQEDYDYYNQLVANLIMNNNTEDEKIRKELVRAFESLNTIKVWNGIERTDILAWLEKQGTSAKLSEEEQNRFAKGVLTSCAMSFIDYLDAHKYEGKMCVSNGECEDIENAFHNAMWDRLHRYYCKYIEKQGKENPLKNTLGDVFDDLRAGLDPSPIQDTQKSVAEIKPKFNVDDWITNGKCTWKIVDIKPLDYILQSQDGNIVDDTISHVDEQFHLFTIKDAKAGDILATDNSVFIFKREYIASKPIAYCGIMNGCFVTVKGPAGCFTNEQCYPATKKQRDNLMKKINKAGYLWDSENKHLIKL